MISPAAVVLPVGLGLEVFALRNTHSLFLKFAATLASVGYLVLFVVYKPPGPFTNVWPLGMNIYCLAQRCWNYLWLKKPDEFYRLDEGPNGDVGGKLSKEKTETKGISEGKSKDTTTSTVGHSFTNALDIALTFRGVGWSFEAKGLPKSASSSNSRLAFASSQLQGALYQFLVLDFALSYANATCSSVSVVSASIPLQIMLGGVMLLYVRWTMDIPYRVLYALAVLSGATKPGAWPPLFGEWRDAFTIRRFWSHTWHQGMRLLAEPPTEFLAHTWLQLPRGSYASKLCRFSGNFFIAFLDHAYGRIIAGGDPKHDWMFFVVQPLAIWVEESTRDVAVQCGWLDAKHRSRAEQWLGYLWTAIFECWTFLFFMEGAIRIQGNVPAKTLIEPALGLSVFQFILR